MSLDPSHGNILIFADDREGGEHLGRWVTSVCERPVVLSGAEKFLIEEGDEESVDLIITDLDTDDPTARDLLDRLVSGESFGGVPQIHLLRDVTLRDEMIAKRPDLAVDSMAAPPDPTQFQARVRWASEVGRLRRELSQTTIRDPMTGLFNRRYLLHRLEEEFARARRYRTPLSLVFFDIDKLKNINDTYGQSAGDAVISQVGELLRSRVRREDVLGRIGEECFAVVLPSNRYRGAAVFASNVRAEISEKMPPVGGQEIPVRISAGVSSFPANDAIRSLDDLVRAVENALVEAKNRGGNRVFIDEAVLRSDKRLVLVVDPDRRLLELAEDLLSMDDYRVVISETASTAMETLRFRRPDLLVLDLQLADEDRDPPLLDRIHALFPAARFPVVGLSRDSDTDPERMTRLGVDRFITKPFSLSLLRSVVRELLDTFEPSAN